MCLEVWKEVTQMAGSQDRRTDGWIFPIQSSQFSSAQEALRLVEQGTLPLISYHALHQARNDFSQDVCEAVYQVLKWIESGRERRACDPEAWGWSGEVHLPLYTPSLVTR